MNQLNEKDFDAITIDIRIPIDVYNKIVNIAIGDDIIDPFKNKVKTTIGKLIEIGLIHFPDSVDQKYEKLYQKVKKPPYDLRFL